jgi:diaminohydroxyphosphoribosylaminopyrimidine deaminase/5-amino-6-(5-phosphoribosylamino)uracil reductase
MRLALAQARRASGTACPNPPVGAVVYRGERVLGRGFSRPAGGSHAEVVAIESAMRRFGSGALRGASMAVTLEPCAHTGRTPPCADRVIAAKLRRVFVGHRDPNPKVAGRGLRRLRAAGIEVESGVLEAECRVQHRGFLMVCESGRPFVSLKLAATLDGRIATARGESRWITGPAARARVHGLRARTDAVMVGSGTALADDPRLTARRGARVLHRPIRVLVDSELRVPVSRQLYRGEAESTWVLCARRASVARRRRVAATGARLLEIPSRRRHLDLNRGLRELARAGLSEVLVEGGGELAAALLREDLVDEIHWFVAPKLIGADGRASLAGLGLDALAGAPALAPLRIARVGDDVHVVGAVRRVPARRRGTRR